MTTKKEKKSLQEQFEYLLKMPSMESRLTKELYETMHMRSDFIAHFDKAGFHKARFWTLSDFDRTIELMGLNKDLKELVSNCPVDLIAQARFKIVQLERKTIKAQIENMLAHCESLQSKFNWEL